MGYIEPESVHMVEFTIANPSDRPLNIVDVTPECSCTEVLQWPSVIKPGETETVSVRFAAPAQCSQYAKHIHLTTDDPDAGQMTLTLRARIGLPLDVSPESLTLDPDEPERVPRTIRIRNDGPQAVKLIYATSTVRGVNLMMPRMTLEPGGSVEVALSVDETASYSESSGWLTIHTDVQQQRTLKIAVR